MQMCLKLCFLLIIAFIHTSVYAQHVITQSERQADQKTIDRYLYKLNKQLVIDSYEGSKSKLTKAKIDNLINESRDRYTEGSVSYSPDNRFKIFVLKGEMVGGHGNCIYYAFIHSVATKQSIAVSPIDHIYKLGKDKYLILQRESTCGGTVFYDYRKATVITFANGKLVYSPFNYKHPTDRSGVDEQDAEKSFVIDQLTDDDHIYNPADSILLKFDPKINKLHYRYRVDYNICCEKNKVTTFSGYFQLENGRFIHKTEVTRELESKIE